MRTFDRETYMAAREAWGDGEFGWQWQAIRRIAAERGFIYPPSGSAMDDRDSPEPSQRAVIWRALNDNPTELERIVSRSRSWYDVVSAVIGLEDRLRDDATYRERDEAWARRDDPRHVEAAASLKAIFSRLADS